jgi:hypothetical protein
LIRYSRASSSYHDLFDSALLLTSKSSRVQLKSARKFFGPHHDTDYQNICFVCRSRKYPLFSRGPVWSWQYGSWIYSYLCNQGLLPLKLSLQILLIVRCTRYNIMW